MPLHPTYGAYGAIRCTHPSTPGACTQRPHTRAQAPRCACMRARARARAPPLSRRPTCVCLLATLQGSHLCIRSVAHAHMREELAGGVARACVAEAARMHTCASTACRQLVAPASLHHPAPPATALTYIAQRFRSLLFSSSASFSPAPNKTMLARCGKGGARVGACICWLCGALALPGCYRLSCASRALVSSLGELSEKV